jgi:hypothetical protein
LRGLVVVAAIFFESASLIRSAPHIVKRVCAADLDSADRRAVVGYVKKRYGFGPNGYCIHQTSADATAVIFDVFPVYHLDVPVPGGGGEFEVFVNRARHVATSDRAFE